MIFNKVVYVAAPKVQLAAPSNLIATPGTGKISLTWTDPEDIVRTGRTVATWAKTRIVRKEGAPPNDHNDGVIVLESTEKNQYQSTPYDDSTVQVGTVYHYGAFSYSEEGVWSEGAFVNATPIAGTPLGSLVEGTLIKIQENGAPVEFYLAKHNYEPTLNGEGRELVVRKDIIRNMVWDSDKRNYSQSRISQWINSVSYKGLFSNKVQTAMETTKFYYSDYTYGEYFGSNDVIPLERSVFLLSLTEYGFLSSPDGYNYPEGSTLSIANILKNATYNGNASTHWTRTPYCNGSDLAYCMRVDETPLNFGKTGNHGVRPCFTLPSTALVDQDLNLIEEVSA